MRGDRTNPVYKATVRTAGLFSTRHAMNAHGWRGVREVAKGVEFWLTMR